MAVSFVFLCYNFKPVEFLKRARVANGKRRHVSWISSFSQLNLKVQYMSPLRMTMGPTCLHDYSRWPR